MARKGIAGFKDYLNEKIKGQNKAIAGFNERYETHPVWALEGVEYIMQAHQTQFRCREILRWIEMFEQHVAATEDDEKRQHFIAHIGGTLSEEAFLDYVQAQLLKSVLDAVRTGSSLSTSPGSNLSREIKQIVDASILDDRTWCRWER